MRWEKIPIGKEGEEGGISGPGKRWGHTCNAINGGTLLYVFGGYGKDNCQTNQVHVFDTGELSLSQSYVCFFNDLFMEILLHFHLALLFYVGVE